MPNVLVLDVVVVWIGGLGHAMVSCSYHEGSRCASFYALSEDIVGVAVEREREASKVSVSEDRSDWLEFMLPAQGG